MGREFALHAGFWVLFFVGLSLNCVWSITVAPVRGGTYFLCRRKESRQRKPLHTANAKRIPRTVTVVAHLESVFSHIQPQ